MLAHGYWIESHLRSNIIILGLCIWLGASEFNLLYNLRYKLVITKIAIIVIILLIILREANAIVFGLFILICFLSC